MEVQNVFEKISTRAVEKATKGAIKIMKREFPFCGGNINAWSPSNSVQYNNCTQEIAASDPQIFSIMNEIEKIGKSNLYSAHELWLVLEEVDNNQENANTRIFNKAINKLHQMAGLLNSTSWCEDKCLKTMRDIIIQLKLISWGYYGAAGSTAGIFLAYHREDIGPYFANSQNNQWPFHPLHKEPSVLEVQFNNYLMQLTEKLSNGTSKASILDMAAFGSSHLSLNSLKTSEANWPLEVNFAILETEKNLTLLFSQYKKLMFLWGKYMDVVDKNMSFAAASFPPNIMKNDFNFTQRIAEDFSTFLKVVIGSHPSALKKDLTTWTELSRVVFNKTLDPEYVKENGDNNEFIMDCSFTTNMLKKSTKLSELSSGCEYFDRTLTNKGVCYSFNAGDQLNAWKPSKITKVFHDFVETNHVDHRFAGAGSNEGTNFQFLAKNSDKVDISKMIR